MLHQVVQFPIDQVHLYTRHTHDPLCPCNAKRFMCFNFNCSIILPKKFVDMNNNSPYPEHNCAGADLLHSTRRTEVLLIWMILYSSIVWLPTLRKSISSLSPQKKKKKKKKNLKRTWTVHSLKSTSNTEEFRVLATNSGRKLKIHKF